MFSCPDRAGGALAQNGTPRWRTTRGAYAESENPARSAARFHRAARSFAASGHDARRRIVDSGKTFEAAARPTNDACAASGASRWPQFLAGLKGGAANFPTALCKPGGSWRGERRAAADSAPAGQTPDAGEGTARPRATGVDLSGLSRSGRRRSHYNFYNVHGAAVVRIHGTNWRSAPVAHADSDANSSCDYGVLVGRLAGRDQRSDR